MALDWQRRLRVECQLMHQSISALLALNTDDKQFRTLLEDLALKPRFPSFTWLWGPAVSSRNRVMFRPFILSRFSADALDHNGKFLNPWKGVTAGSMEQWLTQVDGRNDVELTRMLYTWRLSNIPWKERDKQWRKDVLARATAASSPAARTAELAKVDVPWVSLDGSTALALYRLDPQAARGFIRGHMPWFGPFGQKRSEWAPLLEQTRGKDDEFHFELYRRLVEEKQWRTDVMELARTTTDPARLDQELERRHPNTPMPGTGEVFLELATLCKRDVIPYLMRHAGHLYPRWGWLEQRQAKGLPELLQLCMQEGWLDAWATLLQSSATSDLFDAEVRSLVRCTREPDHQVTHKLILIAGHGREAHFPGLSLAQVHPLKEATALELYQRFPAITRQAFRVHVAPTWQAPYERLVKAAIAADDQELVDFFASRAAMLTLTAHHPGAWKSCLDALTTHFESLTDSVFVQRASNALTRMPAFAIWNYQELLRSNRLARLLFERSTGLYLQDVKPIRDLLESPQIHVQLLAFRVLSVDDDRARAAAAANADLLQASLLRPLHRKSRLMAFKALENAAMHDEDTAAFLLRRMKDATALPDKKYPVDDLVGLIAKVLCRWPALRQSSEHVLVFGGVAA